MTIDDTKTLLALIAETYQNFKVGAATAAVWHEHLKTSDARLIISAFKYYAKLNKFPPVPADLFDAVESARMVGVWSAEEALEYVKSLGIKYNSMTEDEKIEARKECQETTKETLRRVGFQHFVAQQSSAWVTPPTAKDLHFRDLKFISTYNNVLKDQRHAMRLELLSETDKTQMLDAPDMPIKAPLTALGLN